jgi:hypothetical protein
MTSRLVYLIGMALFLVACDIGVALKGSQPFDLLVLASITAIYYIAIRPALGAELREWARSREPLSYCDRSEPMPLEEAYTDE